MQTFEIKLELAHILLISKLISSLGETMDQKLTWMHSIFENSDNDVEDYPHSNQQTQFNKSDSRSL
jgi:hypothetical protein